MNRRSFLAASAGVASALANPARHIVVGLIGAGARGMQLLAACLDQPGVSIGAVCETFEPRMFGSVALARSRGHRTRYYRIYTDMVADRELDAVIVATPDFWHHQMTLELIAAGKDVYLEQPLCLSWKEGVELLRAEKDSSRIIQVGSQRRSNALFLETAEQISKGDFGSVRVIRANRSSSYLRNGTLRRGPVKLSEPLNFVDWQGGAQVKVDYSPDRFLNWRFFPEYGAGTVADLGSPLIDGIHMLTGLKFPRSVTARGVRSKVEGFDATETAEAIVEYPDGQIATFTIDAAGIPRPAGRDEELFLEGAAGSVAINEAGVAVSKAGSALAAPRRTNLEGSRHSTGRHLAAFFESVSTRKPPAATVDNTFPATLVCQMAELSIRTGRPSLWDPDRLEVRSQGATV